MNTILLFITFSTLTTLSLLKNDLRNSAFGRTQEEWIADITGLFIQGVLIPAFPFLLVPVLGSIFPMVNKSIELSAFGQFLLSFIVVDYLYYWNHRIFHKRSFWHIHRLHHTSRHLDLFATSRNSLVTSFLFVYVWSQVIAMLVLTDSTAFMLGLGLTFALDLWRHSGLETNQMISQFTRMIFILPDQHVLHHSVTGRNKNFGANFCWWDKMHGTYSDVTVPNSNLEKLSGRRIWKELLYPERTGK